MLRLMIYPDMRLFLGKGSDFWIINMSKFLNINDCSLFLEIVIYVLKNRLDFWDDWNYREVEE